MVLTNPKAIGNKLRLGIISINMKARLGIIPINMKARLGIIPINNCNMSRNHNIKLL